MNTSSSRTSARLFALLLLFTSTLTLTPQEGLAAGGRLRRSATTSKPAKNNPAATVVTLPSGTLQIIPDPTQCVLDTAHLLHPGRLVGGRIDRAGRGGALIRGPIIKKVEQGIAEAKAAVTRAMAEALVIMKQDMLSQINAAFNLGATVGACDTILANYSTEAEKKCAANQGRFESDAASECAAPGKTSAQRSTCLCLVPAITGALFSNCVALGQSPEIMAAVRAAHASCKQRELNLSGFLSSVTDLIGNRSTTGQE